MAPAPSSVDAVRMDSIPTQRDPRGRAEHVGRVAVALMAMLYLLVTAWAAWWLVGPQAEPGGCDDLIVAPPDWSPLVDRSWAVVSVIAAAATLLTLTRLTVRHRDRAVVAGSLAFLGVAAIIAGGGGRVVTSPVCGANIGGGLVIMFGAPLACALALLGLWGLTRRGSRRS